jgi:chemotaxis protein histidine kinase CheA
LLVQHGAQHCAFAVERMLGRHEVIVRPLVDPLVQSPTVAGSADLGDGLPTLVLDLRAIAQLVTRAAEVRA